MVKNVKFEFSMMENHRAYCFKEFEIVISSLEQTMKVPHSRLVSGNFSELKDILIKYHLLAFLSHGIFSHFDGLNPQS